MTEDFTLFETLRKVAWSALNITITTLNPQIWHERKREPWSWIIGAKKTLDVFFSYVYMWNDNTSFLPSTGADAVAISSEWAGHQSGSLLTINVTQLFSGSNLTSSWVTKWDCESLLRCALYSISSKLHYFQRGSTCWACLMTSATHDATRAHQYGRCLELKHKTKQQQLGSGSECLVHVQDEGVCTHQQQHPTKACLLVAQLSIQHLLFCRGWISLFCLGLWRLYHPESAFDDFLLRVWILLHYYYFEWHESRKINHIQPTTLRRALQNQAQNSKHRSNK